MSDTRKVVLHNDSKTPFHVVLEILGLAFELPGSKQIRIALATHLQGAAEVGEFSAHEAGVLSLLVGSLAEIRGWPLKATVEAADWTPGEEEAKAAGAPGPFVESVEGLATLAEQLEQSSGGKSTIAFGKPTFKPQPGVARIVLSLEGSDVVIDVAKGKEPTEQ